jgi:trehalose 6-phosphate phosphatase
MMGMEIFEAAMAKPPLSAVASLQELLADCGPLALFLDVDGTLLELAETPDRVVVPPSLVPLLAQVSERSGGALALVSGRMLSAIDALLAPLRLPAAGLHGFERRDFAGVVHRQAAPKAAALARARSKLRQYAADRAALLLEDKGSALALHFRAAPELAQEAEAEVRAVARESGDFSVVCGRMVVELRPARATKGAALAAFMREPPFQHRHPVMVGDDITDEDAFEWVNAAGGVSVGVGIARPTAASIRLASVDQVHGWLAGLRQRGLS